MRINIAFIFYALLTSILTLLVAPFVFIGCLVLLPSKRLRIKYCHAISKFWGSALMLFAIPKFHISGLENYDIKKTYIITPNHQSAFDIFLAFYLLKGDFAFISKDLFFKIPIVGFAMKRAGYISVKRGTTAAAKMINEAVERLQSGRSVVLYPEGKRSIDGNILFPKKGILRIAEKSPDVEILPIVISRAKNIMKAKTLKISLWSHRRDYANVFTGCAVLLDR